MIVMGTNSACQDPREESDEDIRTSMRNIYHTVTSLDPSTFILFNTPPPLRDDIEYKTHKENGVEVKRTLRIQERVAEIANVIREFRAPNCGICDLHKALLGREGNWHVDPAHLSDDAEEIWVDLVLAAMEAHGNTDIQEN
jgi:lysophospholipase L1-like esterase